MSEATTKYRIELKVSIVLREDDEKRTSKNALATWEQMFPASVLTQSSLGFAGHVATSIKTLCTANEVERKFNQAMAEHDEIKALEAERARIDAELSKRKRK